MRSRPRSRCWNSGRVTGSTLANPYTVISSAIGTLTGPLHGGANEEVLDMLEEIGTLENVQPWLEDAVANKKKIMGFGHRVYKVKDPRATVLQELAEHVFAETGRPKLYEMAVETGAASWPASSGRRASIRTSISTPASSTRALGIPRDLFTPIFAIARVAGWLAHWLEQLQNNRIFRPEQIYVGKHDVPYVPLEKRPCNRKIGRKSRDQARSSRHARLALACRSRLVQYSLGSPCSTPPSSATTSTPSRPTAATATSRPTSTASSSSTTSASGSSQETQQVQQRQNEVSKLDPQGEGRGQEAGADRRRASELREQVGGAGERS